MFRTLEGRPPCLALPHGTVDTHIHFFNNAKYKAQPGGPPPSADALVADYEKVMKWLNIDRMVIVQPNAYQFDNSCTLDALEYFGDKARAIVAVDPHISDETLDTLSAKGVIGARIMDLQTGAVGLESLLDINARVHPFGWGLILQFDGCDMIRHTALLRQIKGDYVIDHTGKFLDPVKPDSPAFNALLDLVDRGNCYVKLSAYYETSKVGAPDYEDVGILARALINHAPDRIIWATNFPHVMATNAETYPDEVHLVDLVNDWAGSELNRQKIFVDNPIRLYGFQAQ